MFEEFCCGCIVSAAQGRVRICQVHRLERATGDGAWTSTWTLRGVKRRYPANGQMPEGWTGR